MRTGALVLLLLLLTPLCRALDITTRTGTTYKHCAVTKVETDGIVISYSEGVARIPFEDLPAALQAQYHFDPAKAAATPKPPVVPKVPAGKEAAGEPPGAERAPRLPTTPRQDEPLGLLAKQQEPANGTSTLMERLSNQRKTLSWGAQLCWLLAAAGIVLWIGRSLAEQLGHRRKWKRICAEFDAFLDLLERNHGLPAIPADLRLETAERAFYSAPSSLFEPQALRHDEDSSGFRVAKGVGGGGSDDYAISSGKWAKLDSGRLTVTSKRIIFEGAKGGSAIALGRIVFVHSYRDSVELSVGNRETCLLFEAANPLILASVLRLSCQDWERLARDEHRSAQASRGAGGGNGSQTPPPPPPPGPKRRRPARPPTEEVLHGRILGLSGRVTFADIKRQYRQRMLECHPDKVAALGPKLRAVAEEEAKKINAAYEFFTTKYAPQRRA